MSGWSLIKIGDASDLTPATFAQEDTSGTNPRFVARPALVIDDHLSLLLLGAHNTDLAFGIAQEFTERHEDVKVCVTESLADLCDAESLDLSPDALAVKLVGNTPVIWLQTEDEVRVRV